jgi:hypothetical protein
MISGLRYQIANFARHSWMRSPLPDISAFKYLWIDSLCIIQDDADGWELESARMSSVYGCSSINIAATSAKDGSVGCFFNRDPKPMQRVRIPIFNDEKEELYDCVFRAVTPPGPYVHLKDAPLARRAWAFQERLLAPRTLHFISSSGLLGV